jgi:hypothetical protein
MAVTDAEAAAARRRFRPVTALVGATGRGPALDRVSDLVGCDGRDGDNGEGRRTVVVEHGSEPSDGRVARGRESVSGDVVQPEGGSEGSVR